MASILHAVGNVTTPSTQEAAAKALLEGDGHTVTLHLRTDVPDFEGHDLALFGPYNSSFLSTAVKNAWIDSVIPVMWWNLQGITADLGLATGTVQSVSSQTQVLVPESPHAAVTAAGLVEGANTISASATMYRSNAAPPAAYPRMVHRQPDAALTEVYQYEIPVGSAASFGTPPETKALWMASGLFNAQLYNALGDALFLESANYLLAGGAGGGGGAGLARGRGRGRGAGRESSVAALFA